MALGDVYHLTIVFTDSATSGRYTIGINGRQNDVVAPDVDDLGDDVVAWWDTGFSGTPMKAFICTDYALAQVDLRRIDPLEPVVTSYTTGLPKAGTASAEPLPAQNAALFSFRTGKIGRSYRGRVYVPGFTEAHTDTDGKISDANADLLAVEMTGLLASFEPDGFTPVVYSSKLGVANDITSVLVDQWYRTQRRREDQHAASYRG